jgi:glucose/arabinose dehydrogenase
VAVRVLDALTGEPVPGARVTLLAAGAVPAPDVEPPAPGALDPWSARTGPDGRVLLTSRPGELATLSVRHAAHAALDVELSLPLSEEHEETVRLRAPAR